ncbi:unnamed protein product [Owenia fusiformis]|uniref:Uncharacterized protein n=1 Tax=Owenia fusiformis TaxID=6347 RepID=A0A8S4NNI8_OWEFU|nr:unnamed protein product [Owenia fusiformis]
MTTKVLSFSLENPDRGSTDIRQNMRSGKFRRLSISEKTEEIDDLFSIPDRRRLFIGIIVGVCVLVGGLILVLIVEVIIEASNDTEPQPRNTVFAPQIKP